MPVRTLRLLDLGAVPYLHSQTIYHAVASALRADSPDTVILTVPREPYACIGYHQDLDGEIDLGYCRACGLPVLRREIGGGAVYLDQRQLFYHLVFHQRRAPRRPEELYRLFLRGPIEAYRSLGVPADLSGLNDIAVAGRKIGGTGAGSIGEAVVVSGSLIFDFDHATMARLLRAPSPAFRDQVERLMRRYVTSLRAELGRELPLAEGRAALLRGLAAAFGAELAPGELTAEEWARVAELDGLFPSDEWLRRIRRPPSPVRHVKIRAGAGVFGVEQGDMQLTLSLVDGTIDDAHLTGVGAPPAQALRGRPWAEALAAPELERLRGSLELIAQAAQRIG